MSTWPLRFVHASDLHLEQPPCGLADVPDHLREMLLEAPYQAARCVFDTAVSEEVDFLLLAGDVVNPRMAGPRAIAFLVDQFERLAEAGIAVYWAGGRVDPPRAIHAAYQWSTNVRIFSSTSVDEILHERDGQPVASIVGRSRGRSNKIPIAQLRSEQPGLITVGVTYGSLTHTGAEQQHVAYLAVGGCHTHQSFGTSQRVACHSGSPQGRCPQETGPHGCTLVEIDGEGRPQAQFVSTDVLRWTTLSAVVDPKTSLEMLEQQLAERIETLAAESGETHQFVSWNVSGHGPLLRSLRFGQSSDQLFQGLRRRFGFQSPTLWSVSVEVDSSTTVLPREWAEQDTILGDFLRFTERHLDDPQLPLDLGSLLGERYLAGQLGDAIRFPNPQMREHVLKEAAILGADLLGAGLQDAVMATGVTTPES